MKKKSIKNRYILGAGCIAAAAAVTLGSGIFYHIAIAPEVSVVRAATEIQAGEKITAAMIETVKIPRLNLQPGVITSEQAVIGSYASTEIQPHDNITSCKCSYTVGANTLQDGQMLISVTVKNMSDSLSGALEPGDIVTVFAPSTQKSSGNNADSDTTDIAVSSVSSGQTAAADNPSELQYVRVISVTASNGSDAAAVNRSSASSNSNESLPATVTLLCNKRQAAVLAELNQNEIHFALISRGNEKRACELLKKQTDILNGDVIQ